MQADDLDKLLEDVCEQLALGVTSIAILGTGTEALQIRGALRAAGLLAQNPPIYGPSALSAAELRAMPYAELARSQHDVLIVAADENKEVVLRAALPFIQGAPRVLVAGYGHLRYQAADFYEELAQLLSPSIANGYPNSLIHLHQCLINADRLDLAGSIVEFGTFKGGTSMFLARVARRLGRDWPVLTFDTFDGFPERRSPLDMYDHPGAVFTDEAAVRQSFSGWDIELVIGDIVETAERLRGRPVVLAFVDTDNFSSARAALGAIVDSVVPGGAIVFDHYTGVNRFRYTLGERMAAAALLDDHRYFNLHETGVFFRQR